MARRPAWLMALALGGCSPVPAPPAVPRAPARIVSLNPCTDAILAEVAEPGAIAALSAYSSDPAQSSMEVALARRFPATSGELEEVVALKPDLVLSGNLTPPATRAAMARLGLPLVEVSIPRDVPESLAQIRRIARLAGHPERGERLVARIHDELARAAPPPGARALPALVWQAGGMVPGRETLISDLLARTGFANFSAARGVAQANILPLEAVLADPPAVILIAARRGGEENRLLAHPALAGLRQTRRFAFDPVLEWCGGPTIIRAARRLAEVRRATA